MAAISDVFAEALTKVITDRLRPEQASRLAALVAARGARPNTDASDQIQLAHFILTGSGDMPSIEELQRLEALEFSRRGTDESYTVELGGQHFTKAQWEAVQVYAQGTTAETAPLAEVAIEEHPDDPGPAAPPDFDAVPPAPRAGEGWQGHAP
ncbi:hypothetical protein [Longimicrobium sp.]|jgi:hypothetical protein|uniref:hypothetical protein n=1 Tax=Longimicrobium sp. TaxID=2029185 RepID=UPI002EDA152A